MFFKTNVKEENEAIQDLYIHAHTAILTQLKIVMGRSNNSIITAAEGSSSYNKAVFFF